MEHTVVELAVCLVGQLCNKLRASKAISLFGGGKYSPLLLPSELQAPQVAVILQV